MAAIGCGPTSATGSDTRTGATCAMLLDLAISISNTIEDGDA
jgi:hypothetical protein